MKQLFLFAAIIVLAGIGLASGDRRVALNPSGLDYARKLIAEGRVVKDKHGDWTAHKLSAADQNEFVEQCGPEEYARWHLAIDESHQAQSKARYKFPFGDFKNVHRCALIAVQNRARQYGYRDIESAATELLTLMARKQ